MDSQNFVDIVREIVRDGAVRDELVVLNSAFGKNPKAENKRNSEWYKNLNEDDREILSSIIFNVSNRAVFGFLCILDGVRSIEDGYAGNLDLIYNSGDKSVVLNPSDGEMLHDML